ncbi:MAG: S41 family peptidase [Pyramidobacter sp.]|nr:S41 family peptidase [Pyramidobacter sp.]MBP3836393.1 S41 family peptidase [Pyramidobacter sp.]
MHLTENFKHDHKHKYVKALAAFLLAAGIAAAPALADGSKMDYDLTETTLSQDVKQENATSEDVKSNDAASGASVSNIVASADVKPEDDPDVEVEYDVPPKEDSSDSSSVSQYVPTNEDYADVSPFSPEELWLMKQAKLLVDAYQVDVPDIKLKKNELTYWAIKGMVAAYGDAYTRFLTPEEVKEERQESSGEFVGIGITIVNRNGDVVVVAPIDGSPAYKAGIRPMDVIIKIDGKDVEPNKLNATANRLRGEAGTEVRITVSRTGEESPLEFTLVRAAVENRSVKHKMLNGDLGYIRVSRFIDNTADEFEEALTELTKQNMKGLILDMRDNSGGLVSAAVRMADMFLDDGKIVTMKGRNSLSFEEYKAKPGIISKVPIVQLINEGSASASEILAGCLRDRLGAVTIGEKSFGKGCAQTFFNLSDGSGLYITNILYYLPNGESIHQKGIEPDVTVANLGARPDEIASLRAQGKEKEASEKERRGDTQLNKAVETLQKLLAGKSKESLKDLRSTVMAKNR